MSQVKLAAGADCVTINPSFNKELVPTLLVTVSVTSNSPAELYTTIGLEDVEEEGVPPGNCQL